MSTVYTPARVAGLCGSGHRGYGRNRLSFLRRLLNPAFRRARAAEAAGDPARAARLYVEADAPDDAASALLLVATRADTIAARVAAYEEALRWLPAGSDRARGTLGRLGRALLEDARAHGVVDGAARSRLADAARRLEKAGLTRDAAEAWELLGAPDDAARCWAGAGDLERLESTLEGQRSHDALAEGLRRHLADHEAHLAYGARREALAALDAARAVAPDDPELEARAARLAGRLTRDRRVTLEVLGRRERHVGRWPVVLGRVDADVVVRGPSVSRRHATLSPASGGGFRLRDAGSRNGTAVGGVPVAADGVVVRGPLSVTLGDVTLRLEPAGDHVRVRVGDGLDAGLVAVLGEGARRLDGLPARLDFDPGGAARILADDAIGLGGRRITTPVVLLDGDRLRLGDVELRVQA